MSGPYGADLVSRQGIRKGLANHGKMQQMSVMPYALAFHCAFETLSLNKARYSMLRRTRLGVDRESRLAGLTRFIWEVLCLSFGLCGF